MDLLKRKKFQVAVGGIIIIIASEYGLDLSPELVGEIVKIVIAFIIGQGVADFGKEAKWLGPVLEALLKTKKSEIVKHPLGDSEG